MCALSSAQYYIRINISILEKEDVSLNKRKYQWAVYFAIICGYDDLIMCQMRHWMHTYKKSFGFVPILLLEKIYVVSFKTKWKHYS